MRLPTLVKFGSKRWAGKFASSWQDVTFKQYIELTKAREEENHAKAYEVLTEVPQSTWRLPHKAKLFTNLDYHFRFTNTEPLKELPTHIQYKEQLYPIKKDCMNVELGRYRDMVEVVNSIFEGKETVNLSEQLEIMPKMVAIFACEEYNDMEVIEDIAKDLELYPADEIYTLGSFFLQKLSELKDGIMINIKEEGLQVSKFKRVISVLMSYLVIFTAYIIRPKALLVSIKNSLRGMWAKLTHGNIYRIALQPAKKDTTK
tara:strand:+ start:1171 stop:1947 length:777 start_codon:yes stop_codon:yes gene_type:complete